MINPAKSFVPSILVAVALAGCAQAALNAREGDGPSPALRIEFPMPEQAADLPVVPDPVWTVDISEAGTLSVANKAISGKAFRAKVKDTRTSDAEKIGVAPATYTPIKHVVAALSKTSDTNVFHFVGNEKYRIIDRAKSPDGAVIAAPYFVGDLGKYELPVTVTYLPDSKQCLVAYDEFTVRGIELYERSFDRLDRIVQDSGGVEAVIENSEIIDNIIARFQTTPETPWRCIAGAMYHVQAAGWPIAQIEFVKPD